MLPTAEMIEAGARELYGQDDDKDFAKLPLGAQNDYRACAREVWCAMNEAAILKSEQDELEK